MPNISSVGTKFTTGSGSIIGDITSLSFSGISCAEVDVTTLSSTTKSYVLGTLDGGTVEVGVNLVTGGAGYTSLSTPTAGNATPTNFVIRFGKGNSATTTFVPQLTFDAYIQQVSVEAGIDAPVSATYTLRITGAVTLGAIDSSN